MTLGHGPGGSGPEQTPQAIPPGARYWEDQFRRRGCGWVFGGEPSSLARRVAHYFRLMELPMAGRLFDIGCGEGRDLTYFAALGFDVCGIDGSPTGVERARKALAEAQQKGIVHLGDLATLTWAEPFQVILANQSLQFAGERGWDVLDDIKRWTQPGGLNAIGLFRRTPEIAEEPGVLYVDSSRLWSAYAGWQILERSETSLWSPRRDRELAFVTIVARKPLE